MAAECIGNCLFFIADTRGAPRPGGFVIRNDSGMTGQGMTGQG